MRKSLIIPALTVLLAVSCGKGNAGKKTNSVKFNEAVSFYETLGVSGVSIPNYKLADKAATFEVLGGVEQGVMEYRVYDSTHEEFTNFASTLSEAGWNLEEDEFGDFAGTFEDTNAAINLGDWTLENYPSDANTYDCMRIIFSVRMTEWPAEYWSTYIAQYFDTECVVPEIEADYYETSSQTIAVYCYMESETDDAGYSEILETAGWDVKDYLDPEGYYVAASPDGVFGLAYLYDPSYGSLDIYLTNPPAEQYDSWPQTAIDALFAEYDETSFAVTPFTGADTKYFVAEQAFFGIILMSVDVTVLNATDAEITAWKASLTTDGWTINEDGDEATKAFEGLGIATISFGEDESGNFVISLESGFAPIPTEDFPVDQVVNYLKELGADVTGKIPSYEIANGNFEAEEDSYYGKLYVYANNSTQEEYTAYKNALVALGWTVTSEYNYYEDEEQTIISSTDYKLEYVTGGEYDATISLSDMTAEEDAYVMIEFGVKLHISEEESFPVQKVVDFYTANGISDAEIVDYAVASEDASFTSKTDGKNLEVDVYESDATEMTAFKTSLEAKGWTFETDTYGNFTGSYGDTLARVYIGDYTAEAQKCIRIVFYLANPTSDTFPVGDITDMYSNAGVTVTIPTYSVASETAYFEIEEGTNSITVYIYNSSHEEMDAFATAMTEAGWTLSKDSWGDYSGSNGENATVTIEDWIGYSYDSIIIKFTVKPSGGGEGEDSYDIETVYNDIKAAYPSVEFDALDGQFGMGFGVDSSEGATMMSVLNTLVASVPSYLEQVTAPQETVDDYGDPMALAEYATPDYDETAHTGIYVSIQVYDDGGHGDFYFAIMVSGF